MPDTPKFWVNKKKGGGKKKKREKNGGWFQRYHPNMVMNKKSKVHLETADIAKTAFMVSGTIKMDILYSQKSQKVYFFIIITLSILL